MNEQAIPLSHGFFDPTSPVHATLRQILVRLGVTEPECDIYYAEGDQITVTALKEISDRIGPNGENQVEHTPGVVGGRARITGTRIPVWAIVAYSRHGYDPNQLLEIFPSLELNQIFAAYQYYRLNPEEIEADLAEQREAVRG